MKNAQQAGMLCNEPLFWAFLKSRQAIINFQAKQVTSHDKVETWPFIRSKEDAAQAVRFFFKIDSRRELDDDKNRDDWREMVADFELWKRGIE